jgi:hypothetical protein
MGGTMNKYAFPFRVVGLVGMVTLLALIVVRPVGAFPVLYQVTEEPTVRPTATPAPFLELNPTQGVAGNANSVVATGALWSAGTTVTLYWDDTSLVLGTAGVGADGTFRTTFTTPTQPARAWVGTHTVIAIANDGFRAEALYELIAPTPTHTPTVTNTPLPPSPTYTRTPVTPSPTPTITDTPIPEPTLRPITPMVTISPIPPTKAPAVTSAPQPTRTNTPVPGTPTNTRTPSVTPTPSNTPGPGTPSATPQPTATSPAEMAETGSRVGMIFLWGFVLAALLVVFRLLRVRSLPR